VSSIQPSAQIGHSAHPDSPLRVGETCWKIANARRAALLVDGEEYFRALRSALLQARHHIIIAGWDFDTRIELPRTDEDDEDAPTVLGEFLGFLRRRRPTLEIHVLRWDYHWLYRDDRETATRARLARHGVRFYEDACHPVTGCVHHKLVVIDDALAFCGGMDLTHDRWDTSAHDSHEPRRRGPDGTHYMPVHDVQLCISGAPAAALADYLRERWPQGQPPPEPVPGAVEIWPHRVPAHFRDIPAAICRTLPAASSSSGVREIESFYLAAMARTESSLYVENQYFTSERIARALAERCRQMPNLQGLLVGLDRPQTATEYHTMGYGRAHFRQILADSRALDRLPLVAAFCDGAPINVHSKLAIFDERWLTVGSANWNRRSMGFDIECNLVLEATTETHRRTIRHLRDRLVGEHLGLKLEETAAAIEQHGLARLPQIARGKRRLVPVAPENKEPAFGPILAPLFDREREWPIPRATFVSPGPAQWPRALLVSSVMAAAAFATGVVAEELPKLAALQKLVADLLT